MEAHPLRYDRRLSPDFLDLIGPGGAFHDLVLVAQNNPLLDLGFRADPKHPGEAHVTLYLGTTRVIDLHFKRSADAEGLVWLKPQEGRSFGVADPSFREAWRTKQQASALLGDWHEVLRHIDNTVERAPENYKNEGRMQAALSKAGSETFVVFDREAVAGFASQAIKDVTLPVLSQPLAAAHAELRERQHKWAVAEKSFGDEVDALAVDASGRLLVIEVKPGAPTPPLAWTPAQVALYLRIFSAWAAQDPDHARRVVAGMIEDRVRLGLAPRSAIALAAGLREPLEIVPVIAVGTPVTNLRVAPTRFEQVRQALHDAGEPLDGLELWIIDGHGAVTTGFAPVIDERFG